MGVERKEAEEHEKEREKEKGRKEREGEYIMESWMDEILYW